MQTKCNIWNARVFLRRIMSWIIRLSVQHVHQELTQSEQLSTRSEVAVTPADTFIRLDGFKKGFVKINGFNLGRYFNLAGPQKTLYVPAPILKKGVNEILVFESDGTDSLTVEFFDKPDLGSPAEN